MARFSTPAEALRGRVEQQGDCLVWTGAVARGYGVMRFGGKMLQAHRVAYELEHGPLPGGAMVDHSCRRKDCVNIDHLRLATRSQNGQNLTGAKSHNRLGVRNVYVHSQTGRYVVDVRKDGTRHGGCHVTLEAAKAEAARLRHELFGDFAGEG